MLDWRLISFYPTQIAPFYHSGHLFFCVTLWTKKCGSFKFPSTEMTVLSQHCWHVSLYCREKFQLKLLWFKLWAQQIRCMRYFELSFMSSSTQNNGVECQISFVKCSLIIWVFSVYCLLALPSLSQVLYVLTGLKLVCTLQQSQHHHYPHKRNHYFSNILPSST